MNQKEITLEKIKLGVLARVENQMLIEPRVEFSEAEAVAFVTDSVVLKLTGYLWGETGETSLIEYPENWIEALKARWFPGWLKARFPVRLVNHCFTTRTLYPNFRISMPDQPQLLKWNHRRTVLTDPLNERDL